MNSKTINLLDYETAFVCWSTTVNWFGYSQYKKLLDVSFRLPRQCVKEIDNLCSEFLWSGPELNPRKAKFAWSEVCKLINEGGRGLKSLTEANTVCFLKLKLIWILALSYGSNGLKDI